MRDFLEETNCVHFSVNNYLTFSLVFIFGAILTTPVLAQSFFTSIVGDPVVGVDRGSTSRVQSVENNTGFLTFSNTGAEEIGPYVVGLGAALPSLIIDNDQLDLIAVIAGPSDDGQKELLGGGIGYRINLPDTGYTFSVNGDVNDVRLGGAKSIAFGIEGEVANFALGLRKKWLGANKSRLSTGIEFIAHDENWRAFGKKQRDESLRLMRGSFSVRNGKPFGIRSRFSISALKGFDDFGASPKNNKYSSKPGITTDFFRVAIGAEISLPLSRRFVANAGVIGQWTNDSLPLSQRCGYQTNEYARGFDLAYVNGDNCIGGRAEIAYNLKLPQPSAKKLSYSQAFVGIDGGLLKNNANSVSAGRNDSWSSLSLGVRALYGNAISEISLTEILDQPIGGFEQDNTRVWFRSALKF